MITEKIIKLYKTLTVLPSSPLAPSLHPLPPVQPLLDPPLPLTQANSGSTQATSSPA